MLLKGKCSKITLTDMLGRIAEDFRDAGGGAWI